MSRIANQVVCVFGWLTNFHPALVPTPDSLEEDEMGDYFCSDSNECDSDCDES